MSKSKKATASAVIETASAVTVDAASAVVVVSTAQGYDSRKADAAGRFVDLNKAVGEAVSAALGACAGWRDFGALAAGRLDSQGDERRAFMAYAKANGVDFTDEPSKVSEETRDAICDGIRDHYIQNEPPRRYKRAEEGDALLVMDAEDPRPADVTVSATTACVPATSIKYLQKKDKPYWEALTAFRKAIDLRTRVRYFSFFRDGREARKAAMDAALYSADDTVRANAAAAKANKSARRKTATPLKIDALAALIDSVIDQIDVAKAAKSVDSSLAQAVADLLIAARKATGVAIKAA